MRGRAWGRQHPGLPPFSCSNRSFPQPSLRPPARSGWQPPKDTGLWDTSLQVIETIEAGMTPEQKEYWAAQGGYFDQV
jgi:hypothetical protein